MAKHNAMESEDSQQIAATSQSETQENEERTSRRSTVFNFRLPREELAAIEQAASEAGLSVAEYIRKSAAMRPSMSVLARPQIQISVNTPYFQYGALTTWSETLFDMHTFQPIADGQVIRLI